MDELQDLINERQFERDGYVYDLNIEDLDSLKNLKEFIKWLVDNDKIEAHEIRFDNYEGTEFDKVDSTIMLLSIQDNPIEFLISILKIS